MKLTPRRVTVGLISTAVVVTMTGVTTWALAADETVKSSSSAAPVRLIVGYKAGADRAPATGTLSAAGARHLDTGTAREALAALNATTVQVPASLSAKTIATLKSDPNVAYVERDVELKAFAAPNDPIYAADLQPELDQVKLPAAWDTTTGGTTVAVIDTGVNAVGDLAGQTVAGYDFVNNDDKPADDGKHGTTVAALIAAKTNNNVGMAGVCWTCKIMPVKVLNAAGVGSTSDVAEGIIWAVRNKARIINLSLGGPPSKTLQDAVAYANMNGALVVAAAGNRDSASDPGTSFQYPGAYPDVLTVAATPRCPQFGSNPTCTAGTNTLANFSYRNGSGDSWVDVAAPGTVYSMDSRGNYSSGNSGTSFAAPIVSGIAALIKSKNPTWSGWSIASNIYTAAAQRRIAGVNYGKVDAAAALALGPADTVKPTASGISPAQNAFVRGTVAVKPVGLKDNRSGIRAVALYVNGVAKGSSRNAPFGINFNSAAYKGATKLQLRAFDRASNFVILDRTVIVDNAKPAVRITSAPRSGSKISGKVTVKFTAAEVGSGIKQYQLLINGKVAQTRTSITPFVFSATAVPKASTVQIRAYDKAGNSGLSAKYSYTR